MKKTIAFSVVGLAVVVGIIYKFKSGAENPYLTERAQTIDLTQSVSASGKVKSSQEVQLSFNQQGRVETVLVEEGERVDPGTVIMTLERATAASKVADTEAARAAAQAEYDKLIVGASAGERRLAVVQWENARTTLEKTRAKSSADIARAAQAIKEAESAVTSSRTILAQDIVTRFVSARTAVDTAEKKGGQTLITLNEIFDTSGVFRTYFAIQNSQAEADAKQSKSLADLAWFDFGTSLIAFRAQVSEFSVQQIFPTLSQKLAQIRAAVSSATPALADATVTSVAPKSITTYQGSLSTAWTDINAAIAGLDDAAAALAGARNNGEASIALKQSAMRSGEETLRATEASAASANNTAEAEVLRAQAEYEKLIASPTQESKALLRARIDQAASSHAAARAALDATILKTPIAGTVTALNIKVGETIAPGSTAARLLAVQQLEVTADIAEADIPKIALDDLARITLDAFGDERDYRGTVTSINSAETLLEGVVYYKVTLRFTEDAEGVKPGMSADVTIATDARTDTVAVPLRAVKRNDQGWYVEVLRDGIPEAREVTLGLRADNGMVEILEGIKENDAVVVGTKKKK